jgi:hypothetical protein
MVSGFGCRGELGAVASRLEKKFDDLWRDRNNRHRPDDGLGEDEVAAS